MLNNIKEVTMDLKQGGIAQVCEGLRLRVHLFVDLVQVFDGSSFSIPEHPTVKLSNFSAIFTYNFLNMFSHDQTEKFSKDDTSNFKCWPKIQNQIQTL